MTTTAKSLAAAFLLAATATLATASLATASDHGRGRDRDGDEYEEREHDARPLPRATPAVGAPATSALPGPAARAEGPGTSAAALYRKECGACHLAYPPGLLPAESHRRILAGLERHFGQNAELDAPAAARLERYLVENAADAGTHRKSRKMLASLDGDAPLRLTEVPYFQRKHRRIGPDVVARPAVKTLANCAACHAGAQDWDFDEDRVKIPR